VGNRAGGGVINGIGHTIVGKHFPSIFVHSFSQSIYLFKMECGGGKYGQGEIADGFTEK